MANEPKVSPTSEEIVQRAMKDHAKHYWCLVRNLKGRKKNAFDLADLIGEGSTVAHAIWDKYINMETPRAEAACSQPVAPGEFERLLDDWSYEVANAGMHQEPHDYARRTELREKLLRLAAPPAVSTPRCPDDYREWLFRHGYHGCGDFHAQLANGGVIDLAELLADFAQFFQPDSQPAKESAK